MRVAVIVALLVVTTPSEASKSCMSSTEARQHFGSVHIYWHGKGHCWNATPTRRHHRIHKVQKKSDQLKAHDQLRAAHKALSKMLVDEEPVQAPWVDRWVDIQPSQPPIAARQVDFVQVVPPPPVVQPEPMVTPRGVVMVIIAIAVALAIVDVLFGDVVYKLPDRQWSQ
jgi:hypothetical protein